MCSQCKIHNLHFDFELFPFEQGQQKIVKHVQHHLVFYKIRILGGFQFHHAVPILVGAICIAVSERGNLKNVNMTLKPRVYL